MFHEPHCCNTVKCLADQIDPLSFWSYIGDCEVRLDNGATCHQVAKGKFTANGGLREIEMCQLHICMVMLELMKKLEQKHGNWNEVLENVGKQHFLTILMSELEDNDTQLLGPNNQI